MKYFHMCFNVDCILSVACCTTQPVEKKSHPKNWQKHQTAWNINQHVNFQMIATSNKNVNEFVSNFNVFILFLVRNNISYSYFWISSQLFLLQLSFKFYSRAGFLCKTCKLQMCIQNPIKNSMSNCTFYGFYSQNILFCPLFILSNVANGKNVNTKNKWQHMNIIK